MIKVVAGAHPQISVRKACSSLRYERPVLAGKINQPGTEAVLPRTHIMRSPGLTTDSAKPCKARSTIRSVQFLAAAVQKTMMDQKNMQMLKVLPTLTRCIT